MSKSNPKSKKVHFLAFLIGCCALLETYFTKGTYIFHQSKNCISITKIVHGSTTSRSLIPVRSNLVAKFSINFIECEWWYVLLRGLLALITLTCQGSIHEGNYYCCYGFILRRRNRKTKPGLMAAIRKNLFNESRNRKSYTWAQKCFHIPQSSK